MGYHYTRKVLMFIDDDLEENLSCRRIYIKTRCDSIISKKKRQRLKSKEFISMSASERFLVGPCY